MEGFGVSAPVNNQHDVQNSASLHLNSFGICLQIGRNSGIFTNETPSLLAPWLQVMNLLFYRGDFSLLCKIK